jgi:hypothetical protein
VGYQNPDFSREGRPQGVGVKLCRRKRLETDYYFFNGRRESFPVIIDGTFHFLPEIPTQAAMVPSSYVYEMRHPQQQRPVSSGC